MLHPYVTILADRQMTARQITERAARRTAEPRPATEPPTQAAAPSAVTMTGGQFRRLLAAVLPSAATDDLLPQLNAVHVETGPRGIFAAATDRYTFAVARHADPAPGRPEARITIPRRAATAMWRLAGHRDPQVTVAITGGCLSLRTSAGVTYQTPAVDTRHGGFPDWRALLRGLLAAPQAPAGQPVWLNPAFLARFKAATHTAGLRVTIRTPAHSGCCQTLVITAGDWFIGALMSRATPAQAARAGDPGTWDADLRPRQAA